MGFLLRKQQNFYIFNEKFRNVRQLRVFSPKVVTLTFFLSLYQSLTSPSQNENPCDTIDVKQKALNLGCDSVCSPNSPYIQVKKTVRVLFYSQEIYTDIYSSNV